MLNKRIKSVVVLVALLSGVLFSQNGDYKAVAEKMPTIKGGIQAIYSKITYPKLALEAKVQGKVYLLLYISAEGKVDKVDVVKGIGAGCDEAAASAAKELEFTPGTIKDVPVKIKMALPVVFKLDK